MKWKNNFKGFLSMSMSISDKREIKKKIAALIMKNKSDALIISDSFGIIQGANRDAVKMFGYLEEDLIGKEVNFLMPKKFSMTHNFYMEKFKEKVEGGEFHEGKSAIMGKYRVLEGRRKDGSNFPIEINLKFINQASGDRKSFLISANIRDITCRRRVIEKEKKIERDVSRQLKDITSCVNIEIQNFLNGTANSPPVLDDSFEIAKRVQRMSKSFKDLVNDELDIRKIAERKLVINSHIPPIDEIFQREHFIINAFCKEETKVGVWM